MKLARCSNGTTKWNCNVIRALLDTRNGAGADKTEEESETEWVREK